MQSFPDICPSGHIAVVTDVHPDEFTSEPTHDLYASLAEDPIEGVWAIRANELTLHGNRANGRNDRFTVCNMRTLRDAAGAAWDSGYEYTRRQELRLAAQPARLIIETHANRDEVFYAAYPQEASASMRALVASLGVRHAQLEAGFTIWPHSSKNVMLDFTEDMRPVYLETMRGLLGKLAVGWEPPHDHHAIKEYRTVRGVSVADARRVGLPEEKPAFTGFTHADQQKLRALGREPDAVATGWSYTKYGKRTGFMGELSVPVSRSEVL